MEKREYDIAYIASFLMEQGNVPIYDNVVMERYNICATCEYRKTFVVKEPRDLDYDPQNETITADWGTDEKQMCGACGCDLESRVTEWMGACPLGKWKFTYEDWTKYILPYVEKQIEVNGSADYHSWVNILETEEDAQETLDRLKSQGLEKNDAE